MRRSRAAASLRIHRTFSSARFSNAGSARHVMSRLRVATRVTRSSPVTTSGPWTLNDSPCLSPVSSSSSPSQYRSSGSFGSQRPMIRASSVRTSPPRLASVSSSPTAMPSRSAAAVESATSNGSAPLTGHVPSTSVACRSRRSAAAKTARSVSATSGMAPAKSYVPELMTRASSPSVHARTRPTWSPMTSSTSASSSGATRMSTTRLVVVTGWAAISWRSPLSATASPYRTPIASSVVAHTITSHVAATISQSAKLRCRTTRSGASRPSSIRILPTG